MYISSFKYKNDVSINNYSVSQFKLVIFFEEIKSRGYLGGRTDADSAQDRLQSACFFETK